MRPSPPAGFCINRNCARCMKRDSRHGPGLFPADMHIQLSNRHPSSPSVVDTEISPVILLITMFNITFILREEGLDEGDG